MNKSQHAKLTLEKKILLPLLPGFELATFRSRFRRSYQQKLPQLPRINVCHTEIGVWTGVCVNIISTNFFSLRFHAFIYHWQKNWKSGESKSLFRKRGQNSSRTLRSLCICRPFLVNSFSHRGTLILRLLNHCTAFKLPCLKLIAF